MDDKTVFKGFIISGMKVVHLLWNLGTGGIETMLVDIVNRQVLLTEIEGVSIIVVNDIVQQSIVSKIDKRVKVLACNRKKGSRSLWPIVKLNKCLFSLKPDVIHFHAPGIRNMVFHPAKKALTIHTTGYKAEVGRRFDVLYAISNAVREEWRNMGTDSVVVQNGIPCEEIAVKSQYWNGEGDFHIIQVSRISFYHKGQDLLVKAVAALEEPLKERVHLTFVGEGEDMSMLQGVVKECGLGNNVEFLGLKDRTWVYPHLKDYDLFVQPSLFEGFGLTVAEACAAGLPVLVSENEGPLEIICNGKYGATFKNKDIQSLTENLKGILEGGYDELVNKAKEARQHVLETYDVGITAKQYVEEYKKLLK